MEIHSIQKQTFLEISKIWDDVKLVNKDYSLHIMYCFPKLHKTPIGDRFIIASKNCGTKPLSSVISKIFWNTL